MRGVPYQVSFTSGGRLAAHSMMSHGDRVHYAIEGIGRTTERMTGSPSIPP